MDDLIIDSLASRRRTTLLYRQDRRGALDTLLRAGIYRHGESLPPYRSNQTHGTNVVQSRRQVYRKHEQEEK